MAKDLLLEIGLEEVPARFLRAAMNQLREKTEKWLDASRLGYEQVEAYATPRRLAVLARGVAEKQSDVSEEVKGPSRKIAQDANGEWTKAALGFARSQGVEASDFTFREVGGVEYIYATKSLNGQEASALLPEGLKNIISSLTFPKNMRWGAYDFKFVRPIRWMVSLFGGDVVPFEITDVTTGRVTRGHRFLGGEASIAQAGDYVEALRAQHVLVDVEERQTLILNQIRELAEAKNWNIAIKDDLLEEVLFLVETPTALFGTFEESFLNIPQDVLITSMREHQRYFPVLDAEGKLLPFFVTVRNGDDRSLDFIAKGNEKVLRARLSDAKFFYEEDQKLQIKDALSKLENVVFHEELGSTGDKVRRIRQTADRIASLLGVNAETAQDIGRTADICKFDLVTQMVYEFPELQGVMGEDYARKAGEKEAVARAVFEHYQPRFAGESVPASIVGSVVSLADKTDAIVGFFGIGIVPTGSQDPYALRRQAAGIVQILLDHDLDLTLDQLFELSLSVHEQAGNLKRSADEVRKDLESFFELRVKKLLSETLRYDVVDAVIAAGAGDISAVVTRGKTLMNAVLHVEDFKTTVESFTRTGNLASKADGREVKPELFEGEAERELYRAWELLHGQRAARDYAEEEGYTTAAEAELTALSALKQPITTFFDRVMVMAEDEDVRANRLALLAALDRELKTFADFGKLVWQ
ncbi:glycine--tRNA ligase subunit beta [Saccharibacillus sp. CPCC 101409]|uniref:glycine--tRNA ligase subunit beta n=1 Tax=Saccharibacillus sp. CPCC 101409 TaxID=3058041 RepID=UPI0026718107|nr:glycine--tRNA ligase subunit beta [Saccharibacillus sp. CPCC 101409]MDO3409178.1 glycine--tRNA ligase subunit beta [Saccharibacillus sp. CPCC 101409]